MKDKNHLIPDREKNLVNDRNQKLFNITENTDEECLMTKEEISIFLKVSIKTIDKKVSMNEIPIIKVGRLVRFRKKEVLAWLLENNRGNNGDI